MEKKKKMHRCKKEIIIINGKHGAIGKKVNSFCPLFFLLELGINDLL